MTENDKQPVLIALGVVGLIVLVYLGYSFFQSNQEDNLTQKTQEIPVVVPDPEPVIEPEPEPEPEIEQEEVVEVIETIIVDPEPSFVLPKLSDSDQLIKDGVVTLSRHLEIDRWVISDELIRKFVVLIDNTAHGAVPRKHVGFLAPEGPFKVHRNGGKSYVLDEQSYDRYNLLVEIFASIDSQRAVEFYVLAKPLFQEAYEELGYTNTKFDDAIFAAIGRILETPIVTKPIQLVRPVVMYKFANPKLEALSETQKQIVRMGPDNTRVIQSKLSEIAFELRQVLEG